MAITSLREAGSSNKSLSLSGNNCNIGPAKAVFFKAATVTHLQYEK